MPEGEISTATEENDIEVHNCSTCVYRVTQHPTTGQNIWCGGFSALPRPCPVYEHYLDPDIVRQTKMTENYYREKTPFAGLHFDEEDNTFYRDDPREYMFDDGFAE